MTTMRRRPVAAAGGGAEAPGLLLWLAFALVGVVGLLLLLQVQATSCGDGLPVPATARTTRTPQPQGQQRVEDDEEAKVRLGSSPPSCRGKCYACSPCVAVQVPTLAATLSNYKPVGWKCQCSDRLYQP